jgi:acetyl esterase/lipase
VTLNPLTARARLDPELLRGLDRLLAFTGPGGLSAISDITERRATLDRMMRIVAERAPADPEVAIENAVASLPGRPSVPVRLLRPPKPDGLLPAVCYLHAGGRVMGSPVHEDGMAAALARDVGCLVMAPTYRLAPEHPHPAALDDVEVSLRWLHSQADELSVDRGRVALYGRSAGGGLAAAAALRARAQRGPAIAFQLLVYPMLDDRNDTVSSYEITDLGVWDRAANLEAWAWVLGDAVAGAEVPAHAAPARATDLSGLPPTFIDTGELDLFRDEDIAYAARLLAQGVSTELHVYPGAHHAFDEISPDADLSRRAQHSRVAALRRALHS